MIQKAPGTQSHILVIEDDLCYQRLIERCLRRCGVVEIDFSADGKSGMEKVLTGDYDLAFVDIQLPQLDGFMIATLLREQDWQIPLVAMTALKIEGLEHKALAVGFDEFQIKPLSENTILRVLKKHLPFATEAITEGKHQQVTY